MGVVHEKVPGTDALPPVSVEDASVCPEVMALAVGHAETVGVASRFTVTGAFTVVFAALVAVIVTVCGVVTVVGAVYSPDELIVPAPVAGLIDQVTLVFVLPTTVAVNCCVPPAFTFAEAGETLTDIGDVPKDMVSTGTKFAGIATGLPVKMAL